MITIYNLCVTRSNQELNYFYRVLHFLEYAQFKEISVQIVHLDFKSNDYVPNIKVSKVNLLATVYTFGQTKTITQSFIHNLDDLIMLYIPSKSGTVVWAYTGHSDGLRLGKKNIKLMRIQDFCEIVHRVSKKADVMIFDCCLCANINTLYVCYPFTKYIIAATSYQSYLSVFETHSIYHLVQDIPEYCKNIVKELKALEQIDKLAYDTNYAVYEMNRDIPILVQLTLMYKDQFTSKGSLIIYSIKYKDLECCFQKLGITLNVDSFTVFNTYTKKKCSAHRLSKQSNHSTPSKLMIILKRPSKNAMPTMGDIFFN